MSRATFVFNEVSPNAPGTALSANAVAGVANYMPAGVAGPLDLYDGVLIEAELVGATGGPLDVYIQTSANDGVDWWDFAHFLQLAAAAPAVKYVVTASLYSQTTAPIVVGKNLAPALAAGAFVNGAFTDRMRLLFVAGALTSAGAAVKVSVQGQRVR